MSLRYQRIKIYTSEEARCGGKSSPNAIIDYVRSRKLAARCMVYRGIAGCYENGELATTGILDLSYNLPLTIEVILPAADLGSVLPRIEEMVGDGIIAVEDLDVRAYNSEKRLLPRQLRVNEVMTGSPRAVTASTNLKDVIGLMLRCSLKAVPVIDPDGRPAGIITPSDLTVRAGLPIRLELLKRLDEAKSKTFIDGIAEKTAGDVMTSPVITIKEGQFLKDAVQVMMKCRLKRLPVVDDDGKLTGIFSRIDVFQAITLQAPIWRSLREQDIVINKMQPVKTIAERDLETVHPDTPIPEVFEKISGQDIQRVAVIDRDGRLVGLISDADLLPLLSELPGFWDHLKNKLTRTERGRRSIEWVKHAHAKTAADVMIKDPISVDEEATIDEAIKLMTENGLKRLPVVDPHGIFKGMISRDRVLHTALE